MSAPVVYDRVQHGANRRLVRRDVYRVRDKGAERAEVVATEREQFERKVAAQAA